MRPTHHTRATAQARYRHYGATLANLHCVCQPPFCFADSDHDLLAVLYGPHTDGRWHDSVYGIVRTIEGTPPILPFSWRAFIYSGGNVCPVEIGYMNNYDSLFGFDCPAWTSLDISRRGARVGHQRHFDTVRQPHQQCHRRAT